MPSTERSAQLNANSGFGTENWFYALWQLAGNVGIGFREKSSRVVVLVTDTYSVDKTFPPPNQGEIKETELITRLQQAGIAVIGVSITSSGGELGLHYDDAAKNVTTATKGALTADSNPGQMIEAIIDAVRKLKVTVKPTVTRCDDGLSVSFDPDPAQVDAGTRAQIREIITVAPDAVPGSVLRCTLFFDLDPAQPNRDAEQELIVRVAQPGAPFVRVDDVRVAPTGPQGAQVNYQASAVDGAGRPLPVRCQQPPGSLFPVGQTVVTCTATDRAGRTWSDPGLIVVTDPAARGRRIWLARLDGDPAGTLTVTDQWDLSARVGEGLPEPLR